MAVEENRQIAAREEGFRAHEYSVKLFGMKISLSLDGKPDDQAAAPAGANELKCEEEAASTVEDLASFSGSSDEEKAPFLKGKVIMDNAQLGGYMQSKQNEQQDTKNKTFKKPDKPVPCPRCDSLDTKFCYFNNYNVNQPRHFCKNCQRYWTAGGTLRNVPVGAGRRKNKQLGQQRSDCVPVRGDPHDAAQKPLQSEKKAAKLQSLASKMHVPGEADGKNVIHAPGYSFYANGLMQRQEEASMESKVQHSLSNTSEGSNDSRDDSTCGSSVSNPVQECKESNSHPAWPFALFNGACGWGAAPHFCNSENSLSTSAAGNGLWAGIPWPVIRGQAWSPACWNGAWNSPWGCMAASAAAAAAKAIANVGSLPTALGKHPRDDAESRTEGCLWAPKSLRIDDLGQAARSSSFLASLGLENKQEATIATSEGMFKAFQHNTSSKFTDEEISTQADPGDRPRPNTLEETG